MKTLFTIFGAIFLAGVIALVGVLIYISIGRSLGQHWSSLGGPEPMWPAVVGFGAFYVIAISAALLVVQLIVVLVRDGLHKVQDRRKV